MSRPDAIPAVTTTVGGQASLMGNLYGTRRHALALLLIAAILLSGCASAPPLFTGVRTVEVKVPVPVPCIDTVPTPPRTEMPTQGDINQLAAGLELDVRAMDAYIELVDKMLRECAAK